MRMVRLICSAYISFQNPIILRINVENEYNICIEHIFENLFYLALLNSEKMQVWFRVTIEPPDKMFSPGSLRIDCSHLVSNADTKIWKTLDETSEQMSLEN